MSLMGALFERRFHDGASFSVSENPADPLVRVLGGRPSLAGTAVSEASAQNIPVVFACDKVLKETVAQLPTKLMRRDGQGRRTPATDHPTYAVLHDRANRAMTAVEFKETLQHHVNLWGNGYAEIVRDRQGRVTELWPLDPARMTVRLNERNQLVYDYRKPRTGTPKTWIFDPDRPPIFHLRINSHDGLRGRSPVGLLRESFGLALAQQDFSSRFYGQGAQPIGALSTSKGLRKEAAQRIRSDWERLQHGPDRQHRIAILDHDVKFQAITIPQRDAEFLGTVKLSRSQFGGVFRVPAHFLNDLEKATFSNVEHLGLEFITYSMGSHFERWTQAIARDLLTAEDRQDHYAVFIVNALARGDLRSRYGAYAIGRNNGWLSANDIRRKEDEDDIPAEQGGDDYLINGNMRPMRLATPAFDVEDDAGRLN